MFGASQEQQDDVANSARGVGGYLELLEQASAAPTPEPQALPTYTIDKDTRQVRLVPAA